MTSTLEENIQKLVEANKRLEEMNKKFIITPSRIAVCEENFTLKYPDSFAAQVANPKPHYCNWKSVAAWFVMHKGDQVLIQNLECPDCDAKRTLDPRD